MRSVFQIGGTGVAPVKSGVPPDFVRRHPLLVYCRNQSQFTSHNGFERDARNNRPGLCHPPDFVKRHPLLVYRRNQSQFTSHNGFERDARNNRPEACATRRILKTCPGADARPLLPFIA